MNPIRSVSQYETIDSCRARIQAIYDRDPHILLRVVLSHSKVSQNTEAAITGLYRHCFCVEETSRGVHHCHTFTYADLLTRRVVIEPLS